MKLAIIILTLFILAGLLGCEFKVNFWDSLEKANKIRKNGK
jgi:hypothetical protein